MIFGFKHQTLGGHVHVDVFSGTQVNALGKNGTLIFRLNEWEKFQALIDAGRSTIAEALGIEVHFVEPSVLSTIEQAMNEANKLHTRRIE